MDKAILDKILTAQEALFANPEYQNLWKEYELRQREFLKQVETMTREQKAAVWDYCGLLIEMHLHTLEHVVL